MRHLQNQTRRRDATEGDTPRAGTRECESALLKIFLPILLPCLIRAIHYIFESTSRGHARIQQIRITQAIAFII